MSNAIDTAETLSLTAQILAKADALEAELATRPGVVCCAAHWASAYADAESLALTELPTCLPGEWILAQALIADEVTRPGVACDAALACEATIADRPARVARTRSASVPVARRAPVGRGRRPAMWSARAL